MAKARGISKSTGYLNRVFTVEYDLLGMIQAYGVEFVHWLTDEIAAGRINCKQDVDRWAADKHLYRFSEVMHNYGETEQDENMREVA